MAFLKRRSGWMDRYRTKKEIVQTEIITPEVKPEEYSVIFVPIKCPKCGSIKTRCIRSTRPVRYHKCQECGKNFKSIENMQK